MPKVPSCPCKEAPWGKKSTQNILIRRALILSAVGVCLNCTVGFMPADSITLPKRIVIEPKQHQTASQSDAAGLRGCFGKASYVFAGAVIDAAVLKRNQERLTEIPDILAKNRILELTIHVEHPVTPEKYPATLTARLSAPGLNVPGFLYRLTRKKQVFMLKKSLLPAPNDSYYPADPHKFIFELSDLPEIEKLAELRKKNTPAPPSGRLNYYRAPGLIPEIDQEGGFRCWVAVSAMLLSWRDQRTYSMDEVEKLVGMKANSDEDGGLDADVKERVIQTLGLVAENPQSYTAQGFRELLIEHGPLWLTINIAKGKADADSLIPHARIIIATDSDSDGELWVTYIDPNGGVRARQKYADLLKSLEDVARVDLNEAIRKGKAKPSDQPFRQQIIHF